MKNLNLRHLRTALITRLIDSTETNDPAELIAATSIVAGYYSVASSLRTRLHDALCGALNRLPEFAPGPEDGRLAKQLQLLKHAKEQGLDSIVAVVADHGHLSMIYSGARLLRPVTGDRIDCVYQPYRREIDRCHRDFRRAELIDAGLMREVSVSVYLQAFPFGDVHFLLFPGDPLEAPQPQFMTHAGHLLAIDLMHEAAQLGHDGGAILFSSWGSNATVNNFHYHYVEGLSPWFLRPDADLGALPLRVISYSPNESWASIRDAQEHNQAHCVMYYRGQVHVCKRLKQGHYPSPERTTDLAALECLGGRFVAKTNQDLCDASVSQLVEYLARVAS